MNILTKNEILELLKEGAMRIEPFDEKCLGELTYDIRLSDEFMAIETHITSVIDPMDVKSIKEVRINAKELYLQPHGFVLGRSIEWMELPSNVMAMISGKSSIARLGIQVETAYILHPGHKGFVVLEIANRNLVPVKLKYGMRIAQLIFFRLDRPVAPYHEIGKFGMQDRIRIVPCSD